MRINKQLSRFATTGMATAGVLFGALSSQALAQDESFIEEIVVTAAKREQTLQEVPIAVSVTDADTIQNSQILDVIDLQSVIPSLRVTQLQSSANTNFVIRGFGNGANNAGIEPSVGVFIDGVYRSRSAGAIADLPNLQRVEVLRGPQSTLFGKNASAGVISIITQAPQFEWGGSAEVVAGNYGQIIAKGDITGPLSDNVAFSFAANTNTRDGYFDNLEDGSELNERNRWGVRGQLQIDLADNVGLRIIGDFDEIDENCCGTTNLLDGPTGDAVRATGGSLVPNDPASYETFLNADSVNEVENSGISIQADIDFDNFSLVSITSLRNQTLVTDADSDFTSADLISRNFADQEIDTFTQEIRFAGTVGERADWLVGLFYFDEEIEFVSDFDYGEDFALYADILGGGPGAVTGTINPLLPTLGLPVGTQIWQAGQGVAETATQDNQATSLFAQVDLYLSPRATLTLGANYTQDEKEVSVSQVNTDVFSSLDFVQIGFGGAFAALTGGLPATPENIAANPGAAAQAQAISTTGCSAATPPPGCNELLALQPLQFLPPFVAFPNAVESGESDDSKVTWTARLAYDVTDSMNVYLSAATGYKATSFNLSRDARPLPGDVIALQAAGLGVPNLTAGTRFAGPEESTVYELGLKTQFERGALNIAVFDQSIEGFQSNIFIGTGFQLLNAGEQSTFGVEFDGTFYPTDNLELTLAATWMDPEYDSFPVSSVGDLTGETPAGIHALSAVTTATYNWDMAGGRTAFVRAEYVYDDDIQIVDNIPESIASRGTSTVNASTGISTPNGWDFRLWARNLTNDEYLLSAFPGVAQTGSFNGYPNAPRTYGLSIRKQF
ncbi:MAG: TonB-dependent receptor [Pseudomonadota bacterium]